MKFNFVSIPRCASQSIHNAFRTQKAMNHNGIIKFDNQDLFSFAVIREPVDRIRSWWSWHRKHKRLHDWYPESFKEWAEAGFITHWTPKDCEIMGITDALKQWDYVTIDGEVAVDYLVDFKKLSTQLKVVAKRIDYKLGNVLNMGRSPYFKADPKVEKLAREKYPEDFTLYRKVHGG